MIDFTEFQSSFQEMAVLARGGQKVVYSAKHFNYGDVVIKLYFTQNDRSAPAPAGERDQNHLV